MELELILFKTFTSIPTFKTLEVTSLPTKPTAYWIVDIGHAIIWFPDGKIFNCSPDECPLSDNLQMAGLLHQQIEPAI
jgi:hypothetical protein